MPKGFLVILSAGMLTLSFPPIGFYGLVWIALVPLFLFLERAPSHKNGFLIGVGFGLAHVATTMYWIIVSVYRYGGFPLWSAVALTLALILYLSLYWGLAGGLFVFLERRGIGWLFPVAAVLVEYIRGVPLIRFPWGGVEMALPPHLTLSQVVDIAGIYGLGFLIYWVNYLVYGLCRAGRERRFARAAVLGAMLVLLLAGMQAYGHFRIVAVQKAVSEWKQVKVSLIQPNIDQSVKWLPSWREKGLRRCIELSRTAVESFHPSLLIWPEATVTFYLNEYPELTRRIEELAKKEKLDLVFGAISYEREGKKTIYHNSAYLVSAEGGVVDRYDKVRLVPFGEYIPLRRWIPFVKNIVGAEEDFSPGAHLRPLKSRVGPLGTTICFEGIFPEIPRRLVREGSVLLVNLTNDGWFGRSSGPYQHFLLSVFRAVENRTFFVRVTGTGISAIVDPTGRVVARIPLGVKGVLRGIVRLRQGPLTIYAKYGDRFVGFCAVFFFAVVAGAWFTRRKEERRSK